MNIQDEAMKIHSQYGTSEMANYKLQLLTEQYAKEYHESEVKKLGISLVSQQRELLILAFGWVSCIGDQFFDPNRTVEEMVDTFLAKNNCG